MLLIARAPVIRQTASHIHYSHRSVDKGEGMWRGKALKEGSFLLNYKYTICRALNLWISGQSFRTCGRKKCTHCFDSYFRWPHRIFFDPQSVSSYHMIRFVTICEWNNRNLNVQKFSAWNGETKKMLHKAKYKIMKFRNGDPPTWDQDLASSSSAE